MIALKPSTEPGNIGLRARQERIAVSQERALFPKSARLLNSADFQRVTRSGRKIGGRYFLFFKLETTQASSRIGLTVSRKVGNAVVRNRVKRQLRETFRQLRHRFKDSHDWVVIARPQAGRVQPEALRQDLLKLFSAFTKPL